jgi:hypothetical protein
MEPSENIYNSVSNGQVDSGLKLRGRGPHSPYIAAGSGKVTRWSKFFLKGVRGGASHPALRPIPDAFLAWAS